ncbi:hypothetical protein DPEC_G00330600 [Dallia pectoralis]|uniref:Uncharacterized protein n=1 Tax=Dallia pectoralis TaxID=75939 RepID=A0ACC2F959_DALPE|nr:hypothetical protein DPEC_G00330600 [Dallia pectoralis]
MTEMTDTERLALAWCLWLAVSFAAGVDDSPCPRGAQVHLASLKCYWLSTTAMSLLKAKVTCSHVTGGDLATIRNTETQMFIHKSFPLNFPEWVWVRNGWGQGPEGGEGLGTESPPGWDRESVGRCTLLALGSPGEMRNTVCDGQYLFLCEKQLTVSLPSLDSYLTGVPMMSGVYARSELQILPTVPGTDQQRVEMLLFPGLWFCNAGHVVSVELVSQPRDVSTQVRVQILRPYCSPHHHLVPPGCSSLLNPFSCCSTTPLCNTTGGCSLGQYWCPLLEACVPVTSPCSPYNQSPSADKPNYLLPPRYPDIPPFYHLVADMPMRVPPNSEPAHVTVTLSERKINVYPDDILAVQHTGYPGTFLHCRDNISSVSSPWRQSVVSMQGAESGGWLERGLPSPLDGGQWVDGVVCDIQVLYVDTLQEHGFIPSTDQSDHTHFPAPSQSHISGLHIIHPLPDEERQIHLLVDTPMVVVVKILSGQGATSSWLAPVLQTGVPFLPFCPGELPDSWPGCEKISPDTWFSHVSVVLPSVGVHTLNVSAVNGVSEQSTRVQVCVHEPVTGLSVEPHGHLRMLVEVPQVFTAKVTTGSTVKYMWVIDDPEKYSYEGDTYTVVFKKPAEYKLKVTVTNPVSSQTLDVIVTADTMTPLANPQFISFNEVIAVDTTHLYTLRVKADVSLGITFSWSFGDAGTQVNHTFPAPSESRDRPVEPGVKQVYVEDSVSHAYLHPNDYTLTVHVHNRYDSIKHAVSVKVRHLLTHLFISTSPPVPGVNQTILLEAFSRPSPYGILYTWDFGDSSAQVQGFRGQVAHVVRNAGVYNMTVCTNNTLTALTAWVAVEVVEKVSGLQLSCSRPSELKSVTEIKGKVATGTSLHWDWDLGDGSEHRHIIHSSVSHVYKSPGNYTVRVTVSNAISQASQSIPVEIYRLAISGILPSECSETEKEFELQALVNGNISLLTFQWRFGDGSPLSTQKGNSSVTHTYSNPGVYNISVTVVSTVASFLYDANACIESLITELSLSPSHDAVAVGEEVCFDAVIDPKTQPTGYQYVWFNHTTNSSPIRGQTHQCFVYKEDGIYEVVVMASNKVSQRMAKVTTSIQKPVSKPSIVSTSQNNTLPVSENTFFWIKSCTGTDVSVLWEFGDKSPGAKSSPSANVSHVFTHAGRFTVRATASNAVSQESATLKVNVRLVVSDLTLKIYQTFAEVGEETVITAVGDVSDDVNYYWSVDGAAADTPATSQFTYMFPKAGTNVSFSLAIDEVDTSYALDEGNVTISTVPVGSHCVKAKAWNQAPVTEVTIVCESTQIFCDSSVTFVVIADGGSDLRFRWDFGDTNKQVVITEYGTVDHMYSTPGKYIVQVIAFNNVSQVSTQQLIEARELQCCLPEVGIVQSQSTIFKCIPGYFEARVDLKGCTAYKTMYLWEVFGGSSSHQINLTSLVDVSTPLLSLPKQALEVGQYTLRFTVLLQGSPLRQHRTSRLSVVHSSLVPIIGGGSHRLVPVDSDLVLDGSESHDPDVDLNEDRELKFHWDLTTENSTERLSQDQNHFVGYTSRRLMVPSGKLQLGRVYLFNLTVYKEGRRPVSTTQSVAVSPVEVLLVSVECVSCSTLSSFQVSNSRPTVLSGRCDQCGNHVHYNWSAKDQNGMILDLNEIITSTRGLSPNLVVRPGVLQAGHYYTFTLNVSHTTGGRWGCASLTLTSNPPPQGGVCTLTPGPGESIRPLETVVRYNCSGWRDEDSEASQLIYTLQVALSCPDWGRGCVLFTLYRGTQCTFGSLVPVEEAGPEKDLSVIHVILQLEDSLGSKVIALNRTLTVLRPGDGDGITEWLRKKSQTAFWGLLQRGNPQELIPFSIVLSSHLNQVDQTLSDQDLRNRREIRRNMTQALASLPVLSLQDAAQISSALAQLTAVPSEVVCEGCQENVLESVGRMIKVVEKQIGPQDDTTINTGRNILYVIGSSLAAVSDVNLLSSAPHTHTRAFEMAASALEHAGSLMRSLMRSRTQSEESLSLSAPRISAVGYHGYPTKLLCDAEPPVDSQSNQANESHQPHHRCQFLIPSTFREQLQRQVQGSEVVQILFGLDGDFEFLSTANPPICTSLAAMEFTTPQGKPIPIADLGTDTSIMVTLPNRYTEGRVRAVEQGSGDRREDGFRFRSLDKDQGRAPVVNFTLPVNGWLNFTVNAVENMHPDAGLYISLNFSLLSETSQVGSGHVRITMTSQPGPSTSHETLIRDLTLSLSTRSAMESTIFLTPLSLCQYFNLSERRWSSQGLRPLEGSTLHSAHCLTQHLTIFGASLFVHPDALVLLPPTNGPMCNVIVVVVCAVLVLIHILLGLVAHKLDHLECQRLRHIPMCGRPGQYSYKILVKTGWRRGAGTTAHVGISLFGVNKSGSRHMQQEGAFQRNGLDLFHIETDGNLGEVWKIRLWHDNTGLDPSWYVKHVVVWDPVTDHLFYFLVEDWLSVESDRKEGGGAVEKEVLASCPEELFQFPRIFTSQLVFGILERHLWLSLWECPAHSRFTRGQRVTVCALLLHLFLAIGALWYGAVGTQGQSGPVSARLLVTSETVVVGMAVAVLVFPLQCLICFLFRKTRSQVAVDNSVPPSPMCQSVEMDVYLGQSHFSSSSFLSLPGGPETSGLDRDTPSSLMGSKVFDADFWNATNLGVEKDEKCKQSIDADAAVMNILSTPDSGLYSPRTPSLSHSQGSSWSSWSELSVDKQLYGTETQKPSGSPTSLYGSRRSSSLSVYSIASTFIPSPSPDSFDSPTRIGVARDQPSSLLPSWTLCVIYPLVALVLAACLAVVGLYATYFSNTVVLMWLISAMSAFLTSALILEPVKVCVQAMFYAVVFRPVDPEVSDRLGQETVVTSDGCKQAGKVRPPCGFGLLQAKEEARKVKALRSIMKRCVGQMWFLLVVLMVNYQDSVQETQGRLLCTAVKRSLTSDLNSISG